VLQDALWKPGCEGARACAYKLGGGGALAVRTQGRMAFPCSFHEAFAPFPVRIQYLEINFGLVCIYCACHQSASWI